MFAEIVEKKDDYKKLFEHFSGKAANYKTWVSRVKDHLMSSNLSWGRLLEVVEGEKAPLTKVRLATIGGVDGVQLDLLKISQLLWAFLGNHCFANPVYERRLQLTAGEDHNGLELWRALYHETEGRDEHVVMWGIRRFQRFPKCSHKYRLAGHIGEWSYLRRLHGAHLPDVYI